MIIKRLHAREIALTWAQPLFETLCKTAFKNVLWILHEKEENIQRLFLIFYSLMTYLSTLGLTNCFLTCCTFSFLSFICAVVLCPCCVLQELHKSLLTTTAPPCCQSYFLLITLCSFLLNNHCLSCLPTNTPLKLTSLLKHLFVTTSLTKL